MSDDDYVYDEASGESLPASDLDATRATEGAAGVRDALGKPAGRC
jgi:protein PhnA